MKWILLVVVMGFSTSTTEQVEFATEDACNTARDAILADGNYLPRAHKWEIAPTSLRAYCFDTESWKLGLFE